MPIEVREEEEIEKGMRLGKTKRRYIKEKNNQEQDVGRGQVFEIKIKMKWHKRGSSELQGKTESFNPLHKAKLQYLLRQT